MSEISLTPPALTSPQEFLTRWDSTGLPLDHLWKLSRVSKANFYRWKRAWDDDNDEGISLKTYKKLEITVAAAEEAKRLAPAWFIAGFGATPIEPKWHEACKIMCRAEEVVAKMSGKHRDAR